MCYPWDWLTMTVAVLRSEPDSNAHGPDLQRCASRDASDNISAGQKLVLCLRGGDLNTETGEISPDRGNHAIKVTRGGPAQPPIRRRVRCAAGAGVAVPAFGNAGRQSGRTGRGTGVTGPCRRGCCPGLPPAGGVSVLAT